MAVSASERAAFIDALEPAARAALAHAVDLDARLDRMLATARAAWPTIVIAPATFLGCVATRVTTDAMLEKLFVADLYLACAWLQGEVAAHEAFEAGPFREAAQLLGRLNAPADTVEEAKQAARSLLFARDAGHPGLSGYNGHGPLRAWL